MPHAYQKMSFKRFNFRHYSIFYAFISAPESGRPASRLTKY